MMANTPTKPASPTAPEAAAFLNFVNLLLQPGNPQLEITDESKAASPDPSTLESAAGLTQSGSPATASPAQIAEALLRSMLGIHLPAGAPQSAQPGNGGGAGKKSSDSVSAKRPSGVAVGFAANENPLMMLNVVAVPAPVLGQDAAGSASAEPANPETAAAEVPGAPGLAISSGVPSPQTALAFGATLTPKSAGPDTASPPPDASLRVPPPQATAASKHGFEQDAEPQSARGDTGLMVAHGDSAPVTSFASHLAAVVPATEISSHPSATSTSDMTDTQHLPASILSEPPTPTGSTPIREITLRITPSGAPPVDVQVNQRQSEVRVLVRTSDESMQLSLRQDLPELVNALDRAGFHAETFMPHASGGPLVESAAETSFSGSSQDARQDSSSEHSPSGKDLSYSSGERQQQQQQRQREQMHHSWLDQMED
jgi:hypothetical protein